MCSLTCRVQASHKASVWEAQEEMYQAIRRLQNN